MAATQTGITIETLGDHTRNATLSSAVTLTVPAGANLLKIAVETQNVRITFDGTTPTATVGFPLYAGADRYDEIIDDGMTIKVIEVAASAVINYQFYRAWKGEHGN